jgi:hypothetical protein
MSKKSVKNKGKYKKVGTSESPSTVSSTKITNKKEKDEIQDSKKEIEKLQKENEELQKKTKEILSKKLFRS